MKYQKSEWHGHMIRFHFLTSKYGSQRTKWQTVQNEKKIQNALETRLD